MNRDVRGQGGSDRDHTKRIRKPLLYPTELRTGRKVRPQQGERLTEVGDARVRWRIRGAGAVVRPDQDYQSYSSRGTGLDVAHLVADHGAAGEVEVELRGCLEKHARIGLAPRMIAPVWAEAVVRVIRTVIHPSNRHAFRGEAVAHPLRQLGIGILVEIAAPDARLVGYHDDRPTPLIGPETGKLEYAGNEFKLVRPVDETVIHVDNAVPVEKKSAAVHHGLNTKSPQVLKDARSFRVRAPSNAAPGINGWQMDRRKA